MSARLLAFVFLLSALAPAQQTLPRQQQVYEAFRAWITSQPADVQRSPQVREKYKEHLRSTGVSPADIDARLRIIDSQSDALEVERWNRILTADKPSFNSNPNAFLVEMIRNRKPGRALDVGMGQGRNAIWLARQGWDTTGFDPAGRAVGAAIATAGRLGVKLHTQITGSESFDFGENRWDLIVLSYVSFREQRDAIAKSLRPGGIVVIEAFHRDATKGRSIGGGVVFDTAEIPTLFPGLRTVRYQEPIELSDFGKARVRVVQFVGEKPLPDPR